MEPSKQARGASDGVARHGRDDRTTEDLESAQVQWLAMVGHELRTPLAVVVANAELLVEHETIDSHPVLRGQTRAIARNAERLAALLDDVRMLSALELTGTPASPEEMDLRRVVERANEDVGTADRRHSPTLDLPDLPVRVLGDAAQLRRAVRCLIDNAVKFTDDGGSVGVRLQQLAGYARLDVADSGRGIASADQELVFAPFYRAASVDRPSPPGAGLGLTIVDRVVRRHRGDVSVTSLAGRGTTFTVLLPLAGGPSLAEGEGRVPHSGGGLSADEGT